MIQDELDLEVRYEVGQVVSWTHGLRYLCATYKRGAPLREENPELVTIIEVTEPDKWGNPDYIIQTADGKRITTVERWLSPSIANPCPAVLEAYGRWGN